MNAGDLRYKITIQKLGSPPAITTADGIEKPNWQEFKTVWAAKQGLTGRTYYAAAAVQAENDVMFIIRYVTGITQAMQIIEDTHTYHVKSVVDKDGKRMWLYITASELVPAV